MFVRGQGKGWVEVKMVDSIFEPHCVVWMCENGGGGESVRWKLIEDGMCVRARCCVFSMIR